MCYMHYQRVMRHGSPAKPGREHLRTAPEIRFWSKVNRTSKCWIWTGSTDQHGYGYFRINKELVVLAHRFAYVERCGAIPEGLELDHVCRNRSCVRPDHLEPVTRRENVQRGYSPSTITAATGVCGRGHAMSGENTYVSPGDGGRRCRTCIRERQQRWADEGKARS